MNIEIRNLKIAASLSQETTAYTADIYVDGVKTFAASNHGHGACDNFHRFPTAKVSEPEVNAWLADNVAPSGPYEADLAKRAAYDIGHLCDLEMFVGRQLGKAEAEKETARIRRRYVKLLADRICVLRTRPEGDALVTVGKAIHKPTPANLAHVRAGDSAVLILNDADEATKERGLRAYCPDLFAKPAADAEDLDEAVMERLRSNALTLADAKWLLAQERMGKAPTADFIEWLLEFIAEQEAAYAAYCATRDAERVQRAAYDGACAATGQVS